MKTQVGFIMEESKVTVIGCYLIPIFPCGHRQIEKAFKYRTKDLPRKRQTEGLLRQNLKQCCRSQEISLLLACTFARALGTKALPLTTDDGRARWLMEVRAFDRLLNVPVFHFLYLLHRVFLCLQHSVIQEEWVFLLSQRFWFFIYECLYKQRWPQWVIPKKRSGTVPSIS